MRAPRWEYKTLRVDVAGFFGPKIRPDRLEAELDAHGDVGWELVSGMNMNRGHGSTTALVFVFKRPRG